LKPECYPEDLDVWCFFQHICCFGLLVNTVK